MDNLADELHNLAEMLVGDEWDPLDSREACLKAAELIEHQAEEIKELSVRLERLKSWQTKVRKALTDWAVRLGKPCNGHELDTITVIAADYRNEIERLRDALNEAAEMAEYEADRTHIYNHCKQAAEKGGE